jgi:RNA polymerase sigma factor (sigma-70 family)
MKPETAADVVSRWLGEGYSYDPQHQERLAREVVRRRIELRYAALDTEDGREQYGRDLASYFDRRRSPAEAACEPIMTWAIEALSERDPSKANLKIIAEGDLDIDPSVRCIDMSGCSTVGDSVVAWRGLVAKIALNDFAGDLRRCKAIGMGDLLQEGAEILRRAVIRYNPDEFAFTTYATQCIRNGLLKIIERFAGPVRLAFNHSKGQRINVSSYATSGRGASGTQLIDGSVVAEVYHSKNSGDDGSTTIDVYRDEAIEDTITNGLIWSTLDREIDSLPYTERQAVRLHWLEGMSYRDAAEQWVDMRGERMPISGERVRQLAKLGVARLQRALIPFMEP